MFEEKTKRAMIRSEAKWTESGEKNTTYLLNLEKYNVPKIWHLNIVTIIDIDNYLSTVNLLALAREQCKRISNSTSEQECLCVFNTNHVVE